MTMVVVIGSLAAAVHQAQIRKRLAESLNCQCCQVYFLVQFQKQELQVELPLSHHQTQVSLHWVPLHTCLFLQGVELPRT